MDIYVVTQWLWRWQPLTDTTPLLPPATINTTTHNTTYRPRRHEVPFPPPFTSHGIISRLTLTKSNSVRRYRIRGICSLREIDQARSSSHRCFSTRSEPKAGEHWAVPGVFCCWCDCVLPCNLTHVFLECAHHMLTLVSLYFNEGELGARRCYQCQTRGRCS